jgi:hypothetical protein
MKKGGMVRQALWKSRKNLGVRSGLVQLPKAGVILKGFIIDRVGCRGMYRFSLLQGFIEKHSGDVRILVTYYCYYYL